MSESTNPGRMRRLRRGRPDQEQRRLGADDPAIAQQRLPDPIAHTEGYASDPFAVGSPIEFQVTSRPEGRPDASALGRMWESYAAKAALGDLAG